MTAIDMTGRLSDDREYVFVSRPDDPERRESVNAWIWDNGTEFGLPRVGIEAMADRWETHDIQVNLAFASGRVLNIFAPGDKHDPLGADGRPRILGAGPLSYEVVEPFRHWRAHLDRMTAETSAQIDGWQAGQSTGELVPVKLELELELRSAVPPWENGALLEDARQVMETQEEGDLIGVPRFEQLFRATGTLRVGDEIHELDGGGQRIRRQGVRRLAAFPGHIWQSSLFPSGRAFGPLTPAAPGREADLQRAVRLEG